MAARFGIRQALGSLLRVRRLQKVTDTGYTERVKTEIFTFCDFAQENHGKLTVVGTFDTIISRTFPCVHPFLSVVIRLRFDLWEFKAYNFKAEFRDLDGSALTEPINGRLVVQSAGNTTAVSHLVFCYANLEFPHEGSFNFILFVDNKEFASAPLYMRKVEPLPRPQQ